MAPQFTVSVHDIDAGGLARSFELPLPWLQRAFEDTDVSATAPGHADVRLSKTGHDIIVRGKVTGEISVPCARCLNPTPFTVDTELSLLLRPAKGDHTPHGGGHGAHASHGAHAAHGSHASHVAARDAAAKTAAKDPARNAASPKNGAPKKRAPRDEEEYEFSAEEADSDVYDGETVVLDDFLREALLLEAPSFPLCSEDCPGIRPAAKAASDRGEPSIDPRLSPLRALKTKLMLAASPPDAAGGSGREPGEEDAGAPPAPRAERKVAAPRAARPKIQAHRTLGGALAARGQSKARTKHSPKKKAK